MISASPTTPRALAAGVVSLATGDVRIPVYPPADAAEPAPTRADQPYPAPPAGAAVLRAAVAAASGTLSPEQVLVAPGARAAILAVLRVCLAGRPEVLVPAPAWPSYPELIRAAGGTAVTVPRPAGDQFLAVAALARRCTRATGAVVVNSPRNPDGAVAGAETLRAVLDWAGQQGLLVLCDEVYRGVPSPAGPAPSARTICPDLPPHVVVVDGLSKSHALAGLRVGWALGHRSVINAAAVAAHHLFGGVSSAVQRAAVAALADGGRVRAALATALAANQAYARQQLVDLPGVVCPVPVGGVFLFPDFRQWLAGPAPAAARADLAGWLRDRHRVLAADGGPFGAPGHLRLSFALPRQELAAGLDRLRAAVLGRPGSGASDG